MAELPPARHRTRKGSTVKTSRYEGGTVIGKGDKLIFSPAGEAVLAGRVAGDPEMAQKGENSQQIIDPFQTLYFEVQGQRSLIVPPYSLMGLQQLPLENSMLRQCIEAMVTNVEGHGWRWEYIGPEGQEDSGPAQAEKAAMESLILTPNPDMNIEELRCRWRRDLETTGNAFLEIGRDKSGKIVMVNHIPAWTMRLTFRETNAIEVDVPQPRTPNGKDTTVRMKKFFRNFCQQVLQNRVWFKEFGDPRPMDPKTGVVLTDNSIPWEDTATEVIHTCIYTPGSAYGVPRWISQMPSVLGGRQAELTNLDYFRENAIPALAVLVSGGRLTDASVTQIEQHVTAARGRHSQNRVMVLEAMGDEKAANEDGNIPAPKIDLQPMVNNRQTDGFFLTYGTDCERKIRSSFRLPPIFVGQSEDYSHATAKASYEVAESQVFGPERRLTDSVWNDKILRSYSPKFWELRSNPPKITNTEDVIEALQAFDEMGALTPNTAIDMANEYFDLELPKIDDPWGDLPFELTKVILAGGVELKGMDQFIEPPDPETGENALTHGKAPPAPAVDGGGEPAEPKGEPNPKAKGEAINKMKAAVESLSALRYAVTAAFLAQRAEEEDAAPRQVHVQA